MTGWPEGGPAPVPDGFEAGGKARPPRNGAESFPEAERCRAKGCAARKARHGVGRCEEHFEALCGFYGDGNPKAASVRNMNPAEYSAVKRAREARRKAPDGPDRRPPESGELPPETRRVAASAFDGADVPPPRPVPANLRPDPLLPVVQSVREAPEREAGWLAFGGLVDASGKPLDGQLPLLPSGEAPLAPLQELADQRGGPVMARGRGRKSAKPWIDGL